MKNNELFLGESIVKDEIYNYLYPFELLSDINNIILKIGKSLGDNYYLLKENVWIEKSVKLDDNVTIVGPCIIDKDSVIKSNAYIRENVIIGKNSIIGNSTELKNCILFDNVQAPHFNYIGDSILGDSCHLGAGVILSNIKSDKTNVVIKGEKNIKTNLLKVGAFLGDNVEVGCNSVLCPGCIVGRNTTIYPLICLRGIIKENKIVKSIDNIVDKNYFVD